MCLVSYSKNKDYSSKEKFSSWDTKTPIWAYVELTDYCSHKCAWCYGEFPSKDKKHLSLIDFRNILSKLREMGIKQLSLGGGEPTEHPEFHKLMSVVKEYGFTKIHLLTHGDNLDPIKLLDYGVTSVHINYQGSKRHESIHKTPYIDQLDSIQRCKKHNLSMSASITVGKYNIDDIDTIVQECKQLGFDRVRFWETTGVGTSFLKDEDVHGIFKRCRDASVKHGFLYSHSYEPSFMEADINIPCIQVSGLGMYIDYQGMVKFCGALKEDLFIIDMLESTPEKILEAYQEENSKHECTKCDARSL